MATRTDDTNPITELSTPSIMLELARRTEDEEDAKRARLKTRRDELLKIVTRPLINQLVKKHEAGLGCTDTNLKNGFVSQGQNLPRCMRCGLLQGLAAGYFPLGFDIGIYPSSDSE
jgi:hypothetical protein